MKPRRAHTLTVLAVLYLLRVAGAGTLEQAKAILIPEFEAKGEPFTSVFFEINAAARRHDPAKQGVNIYLAGDLPADVKQRPITMHAKKVSVEQLVRQLCQAAEVQCRFGDEAVLIGPASFFALFEDEAVEEKATATRLKAKQIVFPEFKVEEKTMLAVLAKIRREARELDPEKKGLRIVLRLSGASKAAAREAILDMELRQVRLDTLLGYCCRPFGLDCEFGEEMIVISGEFEGIDVSARPAARTRTSGKAGVPASSAGTRERARAIVVPTFKLEEATPAEAIKEIRRLALKHDPTRQGLGFAFQFTPAGKARLTRPSVDLHLRNITLDQVIKYVCLASGLHHRFDANAVVISDRPFPAAKMQTRAFHMSPDAAVPRHTRPKPKKIDWQN